MNELRHTIHQNGYYRGSDFSAESMEAQSRLEKPMASQAPIVMGNKGVEKEPVSREREEQLEAWMKDIKTFIRSIDVSSL